MRKNDFSRVLITIALTVLSPASHADTLTGRVVGIADGDTLTLHDATNTQHKIRLIYF
jgi:endonuclease YncB( thermonuclease family)